MIKIRCEYTELIARDQCKPHPKNRNRHSKEQIDRLAFLIKHHGFRHPIIISKLSGFVVAGHGRLEAAGQLEMDQVPVDYQEFESEEQEYAFLISDNSIALWAQLALQSIQEDLKDLPDLEIDLLGIKDFTRIEIEKLEPQCDEDEVPEYVEAKTKLGDIYQLGNHRLMCGDSTIIDAVENLMDGEKADITFTSPPYNAGKNIRGNFYENYGDDKNENEYVDFISSVTINCLSFSQFVFVNLQIIESNKKSIIKYQSKFIDQIKDILIWNKSQYPPHINPGTFGCKWEYVFAFAMNGTSRSFPCSWQGKFPNVIETENNSSNEFAKQHKAGFPVSFPQWMIEKMDFCNSVMDPFGGTGTTMIACEKTKRKCFMMEIDPHYCDLIVSRWEKYTGKKAELINGQT
jgi:DNA modification methylase